jgi:hypothetical protein
MSMNFRKAIRNESVEWDSVISTWTRNMALQTT